MTKTFLARQDMWVVVVAVFAVGAVVVVVVVAAVRCSH